MGFLGHNFSSRHARRSIKGFIDVADCLVSKTFELQKWLIGLATRARQIGSKIQEHVLFVTSPRKTPRSKQIIFFLIEPGKLAASVKGLGNSRAIEAGELLTKMYRPIYWPALSLKGRNKFRTYIRKLENEHSEQHLPRVVA